MSKRLIRKDQLLRKRHKSFEIWNTLNKSLKKSLVLYGIPKKIVIKKKKHTVKRLYAIIVLKPVEVQE